MRTRKAFTLIELMVSAVLLTLILVMISTSLISIIRTRDIVSKKMDALDSGRYCLQRISADVMGSSAIDPLSGTTKLIMDLNGVKVSYDMNGGKVRRTVNGTASYLTEQDRVSSLSFNYTAGAVTSTLTFGSRLNIPLTLEARSRN